MSRPLSQYMERRGPELIDKSQKMQKEPTKPKKPKLMDTSLVDLKMRVVRKRPKK